MFMHFFFSVEQVLGGGCGEKNCKLVMALQA